MKKFLSILIFIISVFSSFNLAGQSLFLPEDSKTFIELTKATQDFFEAVKSRDSTTMALSLADEFTLTSSESNGETMGKRGYINGSLRPEILKVVSYRVYDFKIRIYGNTAIVQSRIDWQSLYFNQPWNADFLNTDVLVKRDSRWQVVHRHSSYPANYLEKAVAMRNRN